MMPNDPPSSHFGGKGPGVEISWLLWPRQEGVLRKFRDEKLLEQTSRAGGREEREIMYEFKSMT